MPLALDETLIRNAAAGGAALERLLAEVWPEAYRISLALLRDRGLAEDAAQDACAALARSLPRLKTPASFPAWCYRLIVNHVISIARKRPDTVALDRSSDCKVSFERADALDLYDALGALPIAQRAAVILHYYAGLNSAEIAAATGQPASTIRFHLMLARRALRNALGASTKSPMPSEEIASDVR